MSDTDTNGWNEWKRLVLDKLDTLDTMDGRLDTMAVEIARLKVFALLCVVIAGLTRSDLISVMIKGLL